MKKIKFNWVKVKNGQECSIKIVELNLEIFIEILLYNNKIDGNIILPHLSSRRYAHNSIQEAKKHLEFLAMQEIAMRCKNETYKIEIDIVPPKSTGQSGKKLSSVNGRAMMFEKKEAKEVKNMFWALLSDKKPTEKPLDGALVVSYLFVFPYNSSTPKWLVEQNAIMPKTTKPDFDNIPKQIQDVMTTLQFWTDDSIIYNGTVIKCQGSKPRIEIHIKRFEPYIDLTEQLKAKGFNV